MRVSDGNLREQISCATLSDYCKSTHQSLSGLLGYIVQVSKEEEFIQHVNGEKRSTPITWGDVIKTTNRTQIRERCEYECVQVHTVRVGRAYKYRVGGGVEPLWTRVTHQYHQYHSQLPDLPLSWFYSLALDSLWSGGVRNRLKEEAEGTLVGRDLYHIGEYSCILPHTWISCKLHHSYCCGTVPTDFGSHVAIPMPTISY